MQKNSFTIAVNKKNEAVIEDWFIHHWKDMCLVQWQERRHPPLYNVQDIFMKIL